VLHIHGTHEYKQLQMATDMLLRQNSINRQTVSIHQVM